MESEEIANLARISSLVSIFHARSGHPGGVLSSIDLISVLFNEFLEINKKNVDSLNRNRLVPFSNSLVYLVIIFNMNNVL